MRDASTTVRLYVLALAAIGVGATAPAVGCQRAPNVHETAEARSRTCVSCHQAAYDAAQNPLHVATMPDTCQDCHDTKAWAPPHLNRHIWYPVQNKHADLDCKRCHTKGFRKGDTPNECVGCHQKDYDSATNPNHGGFPTACATCHSDLGWRPSVFLHPWQLEGVHTTTPCASCHKGSPPQWKGVPTDCAGCHQKDYDGATSPVHTGLPTACASCHTPAGWRPSNFNHPWALEGAHKAVPCASCHTGSPPRYAGTPKDCFSCHQTDYATSPYPGHQSFSHNCTDCHTMAGWKPALSAGHPEASFPITTGAHANSGIKCLSCHDPSRGPSTGGQNTSCINCHLGAHTRPTIDTKHAQVPGYPTAPTTLNYCLSCHPAGKN